MIEEVIIVEGKDDEAAVKKAINAEIIITNGFGMNEKIYQRIETAYQRKGIIIFTDPDFAGENIRKKLTQRFPHAKHAYLSQEKARKNRDIGIENASSEDIIMALGKAQFCDEHARSEFTKEDLRANSLIGNENASKNRQRVGDLLGIGYGNSHTFLNRLNHYNIRREEFEDAVKRIKSKGIEE
ncbi:MAG: ribonuclease M5 [Peptostreptococcales bacterium]